MALQSVARRLVLNMAELPSDDSDIYVSGDSSEEYLISDQPSSSASHGSRLSTSAESESNCNEEVDELESIDSSEYLELHTTNSLQDSDEDFDLDIAGDSDSDVRPNYVEEGMSLATLALEISRLC